MNSVNSLEVYLLFGDQVYKKNESRVMRVLAKGELGHIVLFITIMKGEHSHSSR